MNKMRFFENIRKKLCRALPLVLVLSVLMTSVLSAPVTARASDYLLPSYVYNLSFMSGAGYANSSSKYYKCELSFGAGFPIFLCGDNRNAVANYVEYKLCFYDEDSGDIVWLSTVADHGYIAANKGGYVSYYYKNGAICDTYFFVTNDDGTVTEPPFFNYQWIYSFKVYNNNTLYNKHPEFDGFWFYSETDAYNYFHFSDLSGVVSFPSSSSSGTGDEVDDPDSLLESLRESLINLNGTVFEVLVAPLIYLHRFITSYSAKLVLQLINKLPEGIRNTLSVFLLDIGRNVYDIREKLKDFSFDVLYTIANTLDKISDFSWGVFEIVYDSLPEPVRNFYDNIIESLTGAVDLISSTITGFKELFLEKMDSLLSSFANLEFVQYVKRILEFLESSDLSKIGFGEIITKALGEALVSLFFPDSFFEKLSLIKGKIDSIVKLSEGGSHILEFIKNASGASPPVITINIGKARYFSGSETVTFDFSWYAPYKPMFDNLASGIIWVCFFWKVYRRIPEIIRGQGMVAGDVISHSKED